MACSYRSAAAGLRYTSSTCRSCSFNENADIHTLLASCLGLSKCYAPASHPEGVTLNSPGSRSAPWGGGTTEDPSTPQGFHKRRLVPLCNPCGVDQSSLGA